MKTNEKMEILSVEELEKVLGGRNERLCKNVQLEAHALVAGKASNKQWDRWAARFERFC